MKVRLILIGMAAGLVLPLAAANAGAVLDPGLTQAGAGTDLQRGAAPTAENFGRNEDEDKGDHQGDNDHRGDNDRNCERSDHGDHDGDHRDHDDKDRDCDKSPSKPDK